MIFDEKISKSWLKSYNDHDCAQTSDYQKTKNTNYGVYGKIIEESTHEESIERNEYTLDFIICYRRKTSNKGKIILICGKIGSGKTTYADKLHKKINSVKFGQDEMNLAIFGKDFYPKHRDLYIKYTDKICEYIKKKSLEIAQAGANVIIDNGFWTKSERESLKQFYNSGGVDCKIHYIDTSEKQRVLNIKKRNGEIFDGKIDFYIFEEHFYHDFEIPSDEEIDERIIFKIE